MSPSIFHRPVIPILVSMIIGILAGVWFSVNCVWSYGFTLAGFVALFLIIKQNKTCLSPPLALFFLLGYLSIQPWVSPRFPADHVVHFRDTHPWKIEGSIEQIEIKNEKRTRCLLMTETLYGNGRSIRTSGRIRVTIFGECPDLSSGDRVSFFCKIRPFRNFQNPGGFNYKRYMAFKNIWGAAYVSSSRFSVVKKADSFGFRRGIENIRGKMSRLIDARAGGETKGLLKALIVGDRTDISPVVRTAFHQAGVGHILAISGLHIGIIAAVSFFIFRWLLCYLKPMLWYAWSRKGAALLTLVPVWVYGLLAGMSPSTQRAVIMVSVFLTAFLFERDHDPINTLAVAALLIVVIFPPSLFSISFQLSFAAVFSILLGFAWIGRIRGKQRNNLPLRLWHGLLSFIFASLFAILGTLPLVMRYFNAVSLVGPIGNLLVIPLMGFVVVPLGLLSVFFYPISFQAAAGCIDAASLVAAQSLKMIMRLSDLGISSAKTFSPTALEIACYYIAGCTLLYLKRRSGSGRRFAKILAVLVVLAIGADAGYWLHRRFWHKDLRITAIDVGQGSAALLELPGGKNLLIDGGGFSDNSIFDIGASVIAPLLWRQKIMTVDTLILTHPNSDHLNGLLYIAEHFNVKRIWTNNESVRSKGFLTFKSIVKRKNIRRPDYTRLARIHDIDGVRIRLLYPPLDFLARRETEKWRNLNNNSLVVHVQFGSLSFLFPGDIMGQAEAELVIQKGHMLKSTVLFSPHHGSRFSSTDLFLDNTAPEYVVISSGSRNRSGLPHPSVLNRYRERGCRLFNTAIQGAITLSTDGKKLTVEPFVEQGK